MIVGCGRGVETDDETVQGRGGWLCCRHFLVVSEKEKVPGSSQPIAARIGLDCDKYVLGRTTTFDR